MHINNVHSKSKQYLCEYCDKKFDVKYELSAHARILHENVKLKCDQCPKEYARNESLLKHRKQIHKDPRLPSFNCDKCDKSFHIPSLLKIHVYKIHDKIIT